MQKESVFMFALKNILDLQADLGQHSSSNYWEAQRVGKYSVFSVSGLTPASAAIPTAPMLAFGMAAQPAPRIQES